MSAGITNPGCCGCGSLSGGSGTIPLCFCSNSIPGTLSMVSNNQTCNYGQLRSTSLRWQATPSIHTSSAYGGHNYWSDAFFTDGLTGYQFQYVFHCEKNLFVLSQVFDPSSGLPDIHVYQWDIAGNVCSPFAMTSGVATQCTTPGNVQDPNTCVCGQYAGGIQVTVTE
jgi:hypothetical protein